MFGIVRPIGSVLIIAFACASCSQEPTPAVPAAPISTFPVSQPGLTTVTGKAARGAIVSLEPIDVAHEAPIPGPLVMDQRGQQFIPDQLVSLVGQVVEFRNGEGIPHNVYVTRRAGGGVELNVSTDPGQGHTHTFTQSGAYDVSCDIHPSMRASIQVLSTPYHAVAGDFGSYLIMNVPPGKYRMVTTAGGGSAERTVDVSGAHAAIDDR